MNVTRITGLAALVASIALSACGGAGAPTTTNPAPSQTVTADAYTGPPAATADVTAFQINFWNNVRVQNRCGQCHNATSPAQMPNFARSDDVNLAYAQANTVVNLATPSTSLIVTKVSGGHNCWLADPNACGQILTTWITNWANAAGASSATTVQLQAPPVQSVGQSLNFPAAYTEYQQTIYMNITSKYCVRCHATTADPSVEQSPYFADPSLIGGLPCRNPEDRFYGMRRRRRQQRRHLRHELALLSASGRRQPQLLGQLRLGRGADVGADPGLRRHDADAGEHRSGLGREQGVDTDPGNDRERREPLRCGYDRQVRVPDRSSTTPRSIPAASIRRRT